MNSHIPQISCQSIFLLQRSKSTDIDTGYRRGVLAIILAVSSRAIDKVPRGMLHRQVYTRHRSTHTVQLSNTHQRLSGPSYPLNQLNCNSCRNRFQHIYRQPSNGWSQRIRSPARNLGRNHSAPSPLHPPISQTTTTSPASTTTSPTMTPPQCLIPC